MIFDITYGNLRAKRDIAKSIGESFPWMTRIKMKGVGCSMMVINMASTHIVELLGESQNIRFANIELRPKGIIVGFGTLGKIYSWAIPYHKLTIYQNSNLVSIYSDEHHIKLKPPYNKKVDQKFMIKLIEQKAQYIESTSPQ